MLSKKSIAALKEHNGEFVYLVRPDKTALKAAVNCPTRYIW